MAGRVLVYGPNGKPVITAGGAWDSAGRGRRAYGWYPTTSHVNAMLAGDVDTIRRRSRDAVRRNPWAKSASEAWVSSAIGKGIRPKPDTADEEFREEIIDAWEDFVEQCDADGTLDFYGQQALIARGAYEAGDGLLRFRPRRPSDGLAIPLQLQALEAEMLDAGKTEPLPNGGMIKAGVEFGPYGKRVAYWLFKTHPGEFMGFRGGGASVRVPADQIIHVFHPLRAGQVRGVPGLATVLGILKEILEVQDAYVMRVKIQNLFTSFETSPDQTSVFGDGQVEGVPTTDDDDVPMSTLEPGAHQVLPPGHEVQFSDPPSGASDYADFMRAGLHAVAVGAGVTYEQATGDLKGVNFTSIRAGLIELRRRVEQYQNNVVIFQMCRPVWRRFFETAVLVGRIVIPELERARMGRLLRARWQPPGFEYVQPEADVKAAVRKIRAGLSSRTREVAKLGVDVELLDREIEADNARAEARGLILESNARYVSQSGVGHAQDPYRFDEPEERGEREEGDEGGEEQEADAA